MRKMIVYVGSCDFYGKENLRQVNDIRAKRSVGSTLKPFLFALAIDENLICTESLLLNVPTFFSIFKPQNTNKKYYGLIQVNEALQKSLNMPFVACCKYMIISVFIGERAGFDDEDYAKYGLSFMLSMKEMRLKVLVNLYFGLVNYGALVWFSYLSNKNVSTKTQIFLKGGAYFTFKTMRYLKRIGVEGFN